MAIVNIMVAKKEVRQSSVKGSKSVRAGGGRWLVGSNKAEVVSDHFVQLTAPVKLLRVHYITEVQCIT